MERTPKATIKMPLSVNSGIIGPKEGEIRITDKNLIEWKNQFMLEDNYEFTITIHDNNIVISLY